MLKGEENCHQLLLPSGERVPYRLLRMQRKTLSVRITPAGELDVRIPHRVTLAETEQFLTSRWSWIRARRDACVSLAAPDTTLLSGSFLQWLGEPWQVQRVPLSRCQWQAENRQIWLPEVQDAVAFARACDREARRVIAAEAEQALLHYQQLHGSSCLPQAWRYRWMRSRWGSCTRHQVITLNLRLATLSPAIIRSVIMHELAHLQVFDHSPRFYSVLQPLDPAWDAHRKALLHMAREPQVLHSWQCWRAGAH